MLKEFREFALKRNVVDLAVGIIIGAAFRKIVESVAGDLIMPVIGALTGGLDFSNYFTPLTYRISASSLRQAREQGALLAWGNFLPVASHFAVVAFPRFL